MRMLKSWEKSPTLHRDADRFDQLRTGVKRVTTFHSKTIAGGWLKVHKRFHHNFLQILHGHTDIVNWDCSKHTSTNAYDLDCTVEIIVL